MKLFIKLTFQKLLGDRHLIYRLPADKRCVALTFDDGPHPQHTPRVLDILREKGVRATFFLIGGHVERHPDLARRIVAEGHAVGMHTYSHYGHDRLTLERMKQDMAKTSAAFKAVLGSAPDIFRPPYGRLSWAELRYCMGCGIRTVMWDSNPQDYRKDGEDALRTRINALDLRGGNIILLHDDMPATVKTLPDVVNKVREAGLGFTTIGDE